MHNTIPGLFQGQGVRKSLQGSASRKNASKEGLGNVATTLNMIEYRKLAQKLYSGINILPLEDTTSISWIVLSPEEIRRLSVTIVDKTTTEAVSGSVNDPAMGAIGSTGSLYPCPTCQCLTESCIGHLGRIELAYPVYHPLLIRVLIDVLKSIRIGNQRDWGKFVISSRDVYCPFSKGINRLKCIADLSENVLAKGEQVAFKVRDSVNNLTITTKNGKIIDIMTVKNILKKFRIEDWTFLGFESGSTPLNFILEVIPVSPPCSRPRNMDNNSNFRENDLTLLYIGIVDANNKLKNIMESNISKDSTKFQEAHAKLQKAVAALYGKMSGENSKLRSVKDIIQGKEGIFRKNIQGNKNNFIGRSVLSIDASLRFGEIGVPRMMAPFLTIRERVTPNNKSRLTKLLRKGKITRIVDPLTHDVKAIIGSLRFTTDLRIGTIVDRHLQNGDMILFNRQPTLHRGSIQAYSVVLHDDLTINLHIASTTGHHADFDGDCGNLYSIQTFKGQEELKTILHARNCIISPQSGAPGAALIYDSLVAALQMTMTNEIPLDIIMDCLVRLSNYENVLLIPQGKPPEDIKNYTEVVYIDPHAPEEEIKYFVPKGSLWARAAKFGLNLNNGKVLFSALLPSDFFYEMYDVIIRNGVLVSGIINKNHIGLSSHSIVTYLERYYGLDRVITFLTDATYFFETWLIHQSYTVGYLDCAYNTPIIQKEIDKKVEAALTYIKALGGPSVNPVEREGVKRQTMARISSLQKDTLELVRKNFTPAFEVTYANLPEVNNLYVTNVSGIKGKWESTAQISGIVGQQFFNNDIIPYMDSGNRCLSYFEEDMTDMRARGLCVNSYLNGINVPEYVFQQFSAREGIVGTITSARDIGDAGNKMRRSLENIVAAFDSSALMNRNSEFRAITQPIYGNDGFQAKKMIMVSVKGRKMVSFVDVKHLSQMLNYKYGYEGEKVVNKGEMVVSDVSATYDMDVEIMNMAMQGEGYD